MVVNISFCVILLFGVVCAVFSESSLDDGGYQKRKSTKIIDQKHVACYYASWATYRPGRGQFNVDHINPHLCSHLLYAFFGLHENGTVEVLDPWLDLEDNWGRGNIRRFNDLKNVNPSLKTLAAVGGYQQKSEIFSAVAADSALRQTFAVDARDFCLRHGFDGMDIGWEFPGQRGGDPEADKANFVLMLADMKRVFAASGLLLTGALAAAQNLAEISYDIPAVSQHLDLINLMAYDFNGGWNAFTGHNSPLFTGPSDASDFQRILNVHHSVSYWLQQGAPAAKINLGIPFYGRTFTLTDTSDYGLRASASGPGIPGMYTQEAGSLAYYEICALYSSDNWVRHWNKVQKIPYGVIEDQWIGYDDIETTGYKCNYIHEHNLAGGMVWSIEKDDFHGYCGPKFALLTTLRECLGS